MNKQPNRGSDRRAGAPLDHLPPGGAQQEDPTGDQTTAAGGTGPGPAAPAEPRTAGGANGDAVRGKATRSPAEVATRPHLEGPEQGPM